MIVNKPKIDRSKTREKDNARRQAIQLVRQIEGLLHPGECLGTPRREGDHLIVPLTGVHESTPSIAMNKATLN